MSVIKREKEDLPQWVERLTRNATQENGEVHFKVRSSTKFQKVFEAFCQRRGLEVNSVRFLFDGERLRADQSPDDYDMEDGDCIDAMMEQIGGH